MFIISMRTSTLHHFSGEGQDAGRVKHVLCVREGGSSLDRAKGRQREGHLDRHLQLCASIIHRDYGLGMDHGSHSADRGRHGSINGREREADLKTSILFRTRQICCNSEGCRGCGESEEEGGEEKEESVQCWRAEFLIFEVSPPMEQTVVRS
jgi:hypothetical protein